MYVFVSVNCLSVSWGREFSRECPRPSQIRVRFHREGGGLRSGLGAISHSFSSSSRSACFTLSIQANHMEYILLTRIDSSIADIRASVFTHVDTIIQTSSPELF